MNFTHLLHLRPEEILSHKPQNIIVPPEMIPIWIGMSIPAWMIALQGFLVAGIYELFRYFSFSYPLHLGLTIFLIFTLLGMIWEYRVLSVKKYVCNPATTASFWVDSKKTLSVIIGNLLGLLGAITDPVDILSFASGSSWLAADLIARGLITFFVLGGFNLSIYLGYTEALGKKATHFLQLIGHPHSTPHTTNFPLA
jgi:hypothetical protein